MLKPVLTTALSVAVNLPLLRVAATYDWKVQLAIYGHAPNQFLFLLFLFPLAIGASIQAYFLTRRSLQYAENQPGAGLLVKSFRHHYPVLLALVLGIVFARIETDFTPDAFYQWQPEVVAEAALLNQTVVLQHHSGRGESDAEYAANLERLKALYRENEARHDELMLWFETVELAVVVAVLSLFLMVCYANLKLLGVSRRMADREAAAGLLGHTKRIIPLGAVILIQPTG